MESRVVGLVVVVEPTSYLLEHRSGSRQRMHARVVALERFDKGFSDAARADTGTRNAGVKLSHNMNMSEPKDATLAYAANCRFAKAPLACSTRRRSASTIISTSAGSVIFGDQPNFARALVASPIRKLTSAGR